MSNRPSNTNAASGAWRLAIFAAAILLPMLVTGCGKKGQEGDKEHRSKKRG